MIIGCWDDSFTWRQPQNPVHELINNSPNELDGCSYVQPEKEMVANRPHFAWCNQIMAAILETLERDHK